MYSWCHIFTHNITKYITIVMLYSIILVWFKSSDDIITVYNFFSHLLFCANTPAIDTHTHTMNSQSFTEEIKEHFMSSIYMWRERERVSILQMQNTCLYVWLPYTFLVSQVIYRVTLVFHKAQSYGHFLSNQGAPSAPATGTKRSRGWDLL